MFRRVVSFVMAFAFLSVLSSCGGTLKEDGNETSGQSVPQDSVSTEIQEPVSSSYEEFSETVTEADTTAAPQVQTTEAATEAVSETEAVPETEAQITQAAAADVASWDVEKIAAFYKDAAGITGNSVKSEQTVGLQDISVNNGELGGVFSFVTPILNSFLSSSTTVTDGITGEFGQLTAGDISSAKAYECSKGTVVEITLNGQTNKADADSSQGSVAHGISVVGDLLSIMGQLKEKGLPIDISVENTVLTYTNPVIKAVIDKDGKIVNGTWSCTVEISLSDYKFAGAAVDSTKVVLYNKITVNGGFNP